MSYDLNNSTAAEDNERQRKWFDSGVRTRKRGYGDLSPFYEMLPLITFLSVDTKEFLS